MPSGGDLTSLPVRGARYFQPMAKAHDVVTWEVTVSGPGLQADGFNAHVGAASPKLAAREGYRTALGASVKGGAGFTVWCRNRAKGEAWVFTTGADGNLDDGKKE